jgi:hypothetical protein
VSGARAYVLCTNRVDPALTRLALATRKPARFRSLLLWFDWRRGLDQAHNSTFFADQGM